MSDPIPRRRVHVTENINDTDQEMTAYPRPFRSSNSLEARPGREEENTQSYSLLIIKVIVLVLIALFVCAGAVLSKVSLVSVTGRMFDLSRQPDGYTRPRSVLFIQLTLLLVIPEVISFVSCLVRGVIGKTTKTFPWPNKWALLWVSHYTLCHAQILSAAHVCSYAQCIINWARIIIQTLENHKFSWLY